MKRVHEDWYLGTADAVYQNLQSLEAESPSETLILAGDHIYKMNYQEMIDWHREHRADVTIATHPGAPIGSRPFRHCLRSTPDYRVTGFEEKPQHGNPVRSRVQPRHGQRLHGHLHLQHGRAAATRCIDDAQDPNSSHDFGRDVIPRMHRAVPRDRLRFPRSERQESALLARRGHARRLLRGQHGPGRRHAGVQPLRPALADPHHGRCSSRRPSSSSRRKGRRMGVAIDSIVSPGCIVSGGRVVHSVLSPGVRVNSYCEVENSHPDAGRARSAGTAASAARSSTPGVKIPESQRDRVRSRGRTARSGYTVTEGGVS